MRKGTSAVSLSRRAAAQRAGLVVAGASSPIRAVSRHVDHLDVFWANSDGPLYSTWMDAPARSICKKSRPQRLQSGKHDYFADSKTYSGSGAWEFFTGDYLNRCDMQESRLNAFVLLDRARAR